MTKKDIAQKNSDKFTKESCIRREYEKFLEAKKEISSPFMASCFAMSKISETGSSKYLDYSEREIILLLEKELPYAY